MQLKGKAFDSQMKECMNDILQSKGMSTIDKAKTVQIGAAFTEFYVKKVLFCLYQ